MFWKMSMDLSKPLVYSEGNLDPIDGYVTFQILQKTVGDPSVLAEEIRDYKKIVDTKFEQYYSGDPLDLGMTLWTSHWFDKEEEWSTKLSERAFRCLRILKDEELYFEEPPAYRLAFREFGTCLGIRCYEVEEEWETFARKLALQWEVIGIVPKPIKKVLVKEELEPITLVMYCSALFPGAFRKGYLGTKY